MTASCRIFRFHLFQRKDMKPMSTVSPPLVSVPPVPESPTAETYHLKIRPPGTFSPLALGELWSFRDLFFCLGDA